MEDDSELIKFRRQWKKELVKSKKNAISETNVPKGKSEVLEQNKKQEQLVLGSSLSVIEHEAHKKVISSDSLPQSKCVEEDFKNSNYCVNCGKQLHDVQNPNIQALDQRHKGSNIIIDQIKPIINSFDQVYYPFVILDKFLKDGSQSHSDESPKINTPHKRKYFEDEDPHIYDSLKCSKNLQDMKAMCMCSKFKSVHKKQDADEPNTANERYLDIFIADLDEITEIPFFDTTVPRELGIKIFRHLDMKELCRCSQVSRSWRSLADDDLLWCRICRDLGYEKDVISDTCNWKLVVQEYIKKKKTLISNWKGRLGKISQLQYPQGRVVCSVHSCDGLIAAGYSNGDVKLWGLGEGTECTFQPSSTALVIDESRDEGTIQNCVLRVVTSQKYTAAAYKHGFVDIWDNMYGTSALSTIQCGGSWCISGLEMMHRQPWLALSQGYYVQIHHQANPAQNQPHFTMTHKLDLNQMVTHIKWLETHDHQCSEPCLLAVATASIVNVYQPGQASIQGTEIHNLYNAPISCIGLRSGPGVLAVGCGLYGGPSESFRVKLYDLTSRRLLSTLQGHTWIVTCLNLADSPPNQLVTGNADRRVRIYDLRSSEFPVSVFTGHSAKVSTVQMDEWKVVSGDEGGFVCVWDQRMSSKLWEWHNRHPVQYSRFHEGMLIVGNVPYDKFPVSDSDTVPFRRLRGSVHMYDFSADVSVQGLPEICHSTYDEPEAYDFNIRLAMPYDSL